jgi:hypothetical protein
MHCCDSSAQHAAALQLYAEMQSKMPVAAHTGQADAVEGCHRAALAAHCALDQWEAAEELLTAALPVAAGLRHHKLVRSTEVKAHIVLLQCMSAAHQHERACAVYAQGVAGGLFNHWSVTHKSTLDLRLHNDAAVVPAVHCALSELAAKTSASSNASSSASDLHILTSRSSGSGASPLQLLVLDALQQLGIDCKLSSADAHRLVVSGASLRSYLQQQQQSSPAVVAVL